MTDDDELYRAELRRLADMTAACGDERTTGLLRDVLRRIENPDFGPGPVREALSRATESAAQAVEKGEAKLLAETKRHRDLELIGELADKFAMCGDHGVATRLHTAVARAKDAPIETYWALLQPALDAAHEAARVAEADRDRGLSVGEKLARLH